VYNSKRLKWHLDEGTNPRTPGFFWWSCKAVNELLVCSNRLLAASPRPRSPKEFVGFCFWSDRQGALANGLHGLNPRNTDNRTPPPDLPTSVDCATGKGLGTTVEQGSVYK